MKNPPKHHAFAMIGLYLAQGAVRDLCGMCAGDCTCNNAGNCNGCQLYDLICAADGLKWALPHMAADLELHSVSATVARLLCRLQNGRIKITPEQLARGMLRLIRGRRPGPSGARFKDQEAAAKAAWQAVPSAN
jgi:hypothetical protein